MQPSPECVQNQSFARGSRITLSHEDAQSHQVTGRNHAARQCVGAKCGTHSSRSAVNVSRVPDVVPIRLERIQPPESKGDSAS